MKTQRVHGRPLPSAEAPQSAAEAHVSVGPDLCSPRAQKALQFLATFPRERATFAREYATATPAMRQSVFDALCARAEATDARRTPQRSEIQPVVRMPGGHLERIFLRRQHRDDTSTVTFADGHTQRVPNTSVGQLCAEAGGVVWAGGYIGHWRGQRAGTVQFADGVVPVVQMNGKLWADPQMRFRPTIAGVSAIDVGDQAIARDQRLRAGLSPDAQRWLRDLPQSPEEQLTVMRALGARGCIEDVRDTLALIRVLFGGTRPDGERLLRATTAEGLVQYYLVSCVPTVEQLMRALASPLEALRFVIGGREKAAREQREGLLLAESTDHTETVTVPSLQNLIGDSRYRFEKPPVRERRVGGVNDGIGPDSHDVILNSGRLAKALGVPRLRYVTLGLWELDPLTQALARVALEAVLARTFLRSAPREGVGMGVTLARDGGGHAMLAARMNVEWRVEDGVRLPRDPAKTLYTTLCPSLGEGVVRGSELITGEGGKDVLRDVSLRVRHREAGYSRRDLFDGLSAAFAADKDERIFVRYRATNDVLVDGVVEGVSGVAPQRALRFRPFGSLVTVNLRERDTDVIAVGLDPETAP